MSFNHRKSFGFSEEDQVNLESVKKMFKSRILESKIALLDLSEHGRHVLKSISKNFGHTFLDKVFRKSVESLSRKQELGSEEYLEISIFGFKAVTHPLFLQTIEKKLSVKSKKKDYIDFELLIPNVNIPYVKNKVFPALTIKSSSSGRELRLKLIGESSFIFVLFQLRKCLEICFKRLPDTLSACFSLEEEDGGSSTESTDTNLSSSPVKVKRQYNRILIDSSTDESLDISSTEVDIVTNPESNDGMYEEEHESEKKPSSEFVQTSPQPSQVFKSKFREQKKEEEMECMTCGMFFVSRNVDKMVLSDYMPLSLICTDECLDPDKPNAMGEMAFSMYAAMSSTEHVNRNTIENLNSNFERICSKILDNTEFGREGFFVDMLRDLSRMKVKDANKVITIMNEVVNICLVNVKSFEDKLASNKAARRNLFVFTKSTGAFFSVIAVIETLYKMYLKGIDLKRILPSQLLSVVDMFPTLVITNSREHHKNMSLAARQFLEIIRGKKIQAIELRKKEFKIVETGRTLVIHDDLYLYHIKEENSIFLFLSNDEVTTMEKVDLENCHFEPEDNKLNTKKWIFEFKNVLSEECLKLLNCEQMSTKQHDNVRSNININLEENVTEKEVNFEPKPRGNVESYPEGKDEERMHERDDAGDRRHCVICTAFTIDKNEIYKYWPPNEKMNCKRQFNSTKVCQEWPRMYGGVCPLVIEQNYVTKYESRKRNANFGKVVAGCVICNAKHTFVVKENPFAETVEGGIIKYKADEDMVIDVEAEGDFFIEEGEEPSLQNPVHLKTRARGLHLKGRERELLGDLAAQQGVQATHKQQMAFVLEEEIMVGNTTSMRSYPVIKMARQEQEKKLRGGATFYESARNVLLGQDVDISPDYPDLAVAKFLPGMIRSLQEYPFKICLANFEMLRIAAKYFSGVEDSIVYIDSSGKFWQERKKTGKDLLNTALVLPPLAEGLSPFPVFEMISENNKTQDFIDMIQHAWHNMALSMNNTAVPYPTFGVTDLSFPNLHAMLMVFNNIKLPEYLKTTYHSLMKGEPISHPTIVTVCVNHLLPAILKTSRAHTQEKVVADTVVAGLMLVLRADSMGSALTIWESLVKVHCEKGVNIEARNIIKEASIGNLSSFEMVTDFEDDTPQDELVMYGNRRALRLNSDYYHLFKRTIEKVEKNNEHESVITNGLYKPSLVKFLNKQYLSLFPLMSASVLKGGGLKSNSHIELYWKSKRAIMAKVPTPQHWPAKLINIQHHETRRQAKEIQLHSLVPNLKFGGKKLSQKTAKYPDLMHDLSGKKSKSGDYFMPTPSKKEKKERRQNESYDGSKEMWGPKRKARNNNSFYMKDKIIDHDRIEERMDKQTTKEKEAAENVEVESIRITGNENKGGVVVTKADIDWILREHSYVSDNAINAGLLLLDKKLNDPGIQNSEVINVYGTSELRLMLSGVEGYVKPGKFLCIMPRDFAMNDVDVQQTQPKGQQSSDPGSHFTLVSNLYCGDYEVNCYETFPPFRNQESLLTTQGSKLIRMLFGLNDGDSQLIEVNAMNVARQREAECGALAFAIALQLCFHYHMGGIFNQIQNVRRHLFECLKRNELSDFTSKPNHVNDEMLFSINI